MTSKHLYCKLFYEELKRKLWAVALLGLAMFFALPVATAVLFSSWRAELFESGAEALKRLMHFVQMMLDFGRGYPGVRLILFWAAVVLGVSSFSYLHDKKQVDFYHSLPARRGLLFGVHMGVGLAIPAAIYVAALLIEMVVLMLNDALPFQVLFWAVRGFAGHMLYYALVYSTVVLAVMLTGTKIAAFLGTIVFFFYFPALGLLISAYCQTFFDTYTFWSYPWWDQLLRQLPPLSVFAVSLSEGLRAVECIKAIAATLALSAASFFLYQVRPLEAAGRTMAFRWSKGIIKVFLVSAFGLAGAAFFYMIQDGLGWLVFGGVVGVAISHCVIEVIYYSDFKKLFCHEKTMAVCMTGVLILTLSFYFDLFRYDAYLPKAEQVAAADIDFGEDSWVSYELVETTDGGITSSNGTWHLISDGTGTVQDIQAVLKVAQEGIRQLEAEDEGAAVSGEEAYYSYCDVVIGYTLTSGRKVYRQYRMYLDPVLQEADRIYGEPGYKKALYPGLAIPAKEAAAHTVYRKLGEEVETLQGTEAQWEAVVRAYQEEFGAMTLDRRRSEAPVGELLLISDADDELLQKSYNGTGSRYERYGWYDGYFYPLYPAFTKTIQALADCGIQAGTLYEVDDLMGVQITAYGPFDDEDGQDPDCMTDPDSMMDPEDMMDPDSMMDPEDMMDPDSMMDLEDSVIGSLDEDLQEIAEGPYTLSYTEPEEIRAILDAFVDYRRRYKNTMLLTDDRYNVVLYVPGQLAGRDGDTEVDGTLIRGKVPAFVLEDFKAAEKGYPQQQEGGEG